MKYLRKDLQRLGGKNKSALQSIFTSYGEDDEKLYYHNALSFRFTCASYRAMSEMAMYISIPLSELRLDGAEYPVFLADYFLRQFSPSIRELSEDNKNINKEPWKKGTVQAQETNEIITRRNGAFVIGDALCVKLLVSFPLTNGVFVKGKQSAALIAGVLRVTDREISLFDLADYRAKESVYTKQQELRRYIRENDLTAFVADGSILPRENGTAEPMKNALPFVSPATLRVKIPLADGTELTGMGLRRGVTVITGGGYSGKSTLLDAIETGIYDCVSGDGRELVVTDETALKIYAEDGRPVHGLDMSPFFKRLPGGLDVRSFSTLHASGSVSQAANIIEAVAGRCRLLLLDEDRSATNFMIRDANMRRIVRHEPIIPFTDRVRELCAQKDVSTILVIGGSSEYLRCADTVILMDDYAASDVTGEIAQLNLPQPDEEEQPADWTASRRLLPKKTSQPFLFFRSVLSENAKKIILDEYSADITLLTALISEFQLNSLASAMEKLLTNMQSDRESLIDLAAAAAEQLFDAETGEVTQQFGLRTERWYEALRPLDIFACVNRMRGVSFT